MVVFRKAGKVRNWFRASFSPFLKRTTLETPCSSPLLIVFVCKLFNLTEVTRSNGDLEQSFLSPALWYWTKYMYEVLWKNNLQIKEATFLSRRMAVQKGRATFPCQGTSWSPVMEKKTRELVHQRAQRNGGKVECHIEKCEGTRFHTLSVQWACFNAGRRICPQFQRKPDRMYRS